jgi:hypothetical protein
MGSVTETGQSGFTHVKYMIVSLQSESIILIYFDEYDHLLGNG